MQKKRKAAVGSKGSRIVQRGRTSFGRHAIPPVKIRTKQPVTMRLDVEILEAYRATGRGWQARVNADLLQIVRGRRNA